MDLFSLISINMFHRIGQSQPMNRSRRTHDREVKTARCPRGRHSLGTTPRYLVRVWNSIGWFSDSTTRKSWDREPTSSFQHFEVGEWVLQLLQTIGDYCFWRIEICDLGRFEMFVILQNVLQRCMSRGRSLASKQQKCCLGLTSAFCGIGSVLPRSRCYCLGLASVLSLLPCLDSRHQNL